MKSLDAISWRTNTFADGKFRAVFRRTRNSSGRKVKRLRGPILVPGASGFIGANLLRMILRWRDDAYGVATRLPAWRLEGLPRENVRIADLLVDSNLDHLLHAIKPRTIFDCVAYGAYSFETDSQLVTGLTLLSLPGCWND